MKSHPISFMDILLNWFFFQKYIAGKTNGIGDFNTIHFYINYSFLALDGCLQTRLVTIWRKSTVLSFLSSNLF